MADPDLSVEEAAERCGFSDIAFFRTVFSRETGLTPSGYRKRVSSGYSPADHSEPLGFA